MVPRFKQSLVAVLLVTLSCATLCAYPAMVWAQATDTPADNTKAPVEPTPMQDLIPSDQPEHIPGTEPLYDKGVTITKIQITGNNLVSADTILKAIDTRPGSLYSKRRLQNDLKKIYDLGYFTDHLRVVPVATRDGVEVRYEVEENPTVNKVVFVNNTVVKSADLEPIFSPQIGMPQNVNEINQDIQKVEQYYKDKGYVLARVDNINEDPPGTIKLTLNEGKIDRITYSGNKRTRSYVLRRAMAEREGEIYNEKIVAEDLKRIYGTQSFSDVRRVIKASPENPNDYELVIEVDEKKTATISVGGGLDTGTGVFGNVGYSDANFLGRGQNLSSVFSLGTGVIGNSQTTVSHRVLQFQTNWFNPSIAETSNSLGVSLYARDMASFNIPLALERRIGTEVTVARPLDKYPGASVSLGLGYENTAIREGTDPATLNSFNVSPAERQQELKSGSYVFLDPTFAFDSRDNRFNPTSGWLNTFGARAAGGITNTSYGTVSANIRRYLKLTQGVSLAFNVQGGSEVFGTIPQFNQFRLGGAYSVRGYQEGGVGTGQEYLLASAEVRSKVPFLDALTHHSKYADMVQLAGFIDAGSLFDQPLSNKIKNVGNNNRSFGYPGAAVSAGAGFRFNIPLLGPLRIDFAKPFIVGHHGSNLRFLNFGVGQKF